MVKRFAWARSCKFKGCSNTTKDRDGYCREHKKQGYKARIRVKLSHALYNTAAWRKYSRWYRSIHPLCVNHNVCGNLAYCVDHIVPVESGGDFWDESNHQPMCRRCHDKKRAEESNLAQGRGGMGSQS